MQLGAIINSRIHFFFRIVAFSFLNHLSDIDANYSGTFIEFNPNLTHNEKLRKRISKLPMTNLLNVLSLQTDGWNVDLSRLHLSFCAL